MSPIYLDSVTGQRLQSPDYAVPATDVLTGKLGSVQTVQLQYLKVTNQKGTPVAAPSPTIKFGLKAGTVSRGHYSDTTFDCYTDQFTAPSDPTLAGAFYTATLTVDSVALRALFPVAADGTSAGTADLIAEVLSGGVPSATFAFQAQNNVIKGSESPAVAVAGASGYPTPARVRANVDFGYADYSAMAATTTDALYAGKAQSFTNLAGTGTQNFFSVYNPTSHTYARNPGCIVSWPSYVSCWNSANADGTGGNRGCVTMLTALHGVTNHHFGSIYVPGVRHDFLGTDGQTYHANVLSSVQVGATDVQLVTFDAPLPTSVGFAKVLAPGVPSQALPGGTPLLSLNQQKQAIIVELVSAPNSSALELVVRTAIAPNRAPWSVAGPAVAGDSDSPIFALLNGETVLLATYHTPTAGPSYAENAAAINALLPSGYALTVATLHLLPYLANNAVVQAWDGAADASIDALTTLFVLTDNGITTPVAATRQVLLPDPTLGARLSVVLPAFGPASLVFKPANQTTSINGYSLLNVLHCDTPQVLSFVGLSGARWGIDITVTRMGGSASFVSVGTGNLSVGSEIDLGDGDGGQPVWQDSNGELSFTSAFGVFDADSHLVPVAVGLGQSARRNLTTGAWEAYTPGVPPSADPHIAGAIWWNGTAFVRSNG